MNKTKITPVVLVIVALVTAFVVGFASMLPEIQAQQIKPVQYGPPIPSVQYGPPIPSDPPLQLPNKTVKYVTFDKRDDAALFILELNPNNLISITEIGHTNIRTTIWYWSK